MINKERKIDLFIKYGKITVTTFIIVVVIAMISLYAHWWREINNNLTEYYSILETIVIIEGYAFLGTFIIMAVISTVLILMIKEKNRILNQNA